MEKLYKIIKTKEKPKQNNTKEIILIFLVLTNSSNVKPEIKDTYPGISGSTQGDKKLIRPAPKAINISSINYFLFNIFFISFAVKAFGLLHLVKIF